MRRDVEFSVIMVCFNAKDTIGAAICSVLEQSHHNLELIIVDGRSTDGSLDVVNSFNDPRLVVVSEIDSGIYDAMNKGLRLANGRYIGFLNADDIYYSNYTLETVRKKFLWVDSQKAVVFGDVVFFSQANPSKITRFYGAVLFEIFGFRFGFMPPHTATFLTKEVVEEAGFFSLDLNIASDFEWLLRAFKSRGLKRARLPIFLTAMCNGGVSNNGISSMIQISREMGIALERNGCVIRFVLLRLPIKFFYNVLRNIRYRLG